MKIRHRTPAARWFEAPASDPVSDDYAAEVQQATERGEREHRLARERLDRAERKLAAACAREAGAARKKQIRQLEELVARRRDELAAYERLMTAPVTTPRRARHRTGRDDHLELGVHQRVHPREDTQ